MIRLTVLVVLAVLAAPHITALVSATPVWGGVGVAAGVVAVAVVVRDFFTR